MPVTSNEIAGLLGQQQQQMASQYYYAHSISQNSPFAGLEQRATNMNSMQGGIASAVMGAHGTQVGTGMVSAGMGVLGAAAAFGAAPRIFDPFTSTANAVSMGLRGGGVAGGIGAGLATGGAYMAIGAAANMTTQQIIRGAQERAHMHSTIMGNAPMAGMHMGMGSGATNMMTDAAMGIMDVGQASGLGANLGISQMSNLVGMGMQSGKFRGVRSVNEFRAKLKKMTAEAVQMASLMKSTVEEAQGTLDMLQGMGIGSASAGGFMAGMGTAMSSTGLNIQTQMQMAAGGSQMFRQMGLGGGAGARYGLNVGQQVGYAATQGTISAQQLNDMGGVNSASGKFTNAAVRILSGRQGMRLLGAMIDADGNLDTQAAFKIASGQLTRKDIMAESRRRTREYGRDHLLSNRTEVMGQFMEQFGPSGALAGAESMFSDKNNPEFMTQMLSGLGKREISALRGMGGSGGLQLKIRQAAAAGMREGSGGASTIGDMLNKAMDKVTGPVKSFFQKMGRDLQKGISGALDDMNRTITGAPTPAMASSGIGFDSAMSYTLGLGAQDAGMHSAAAGIGGGMFGSGATGLGIGTPTGLLPNALAMAGAGGNISDMANNGFAFSSVGGGVGAILARSPAMAAGLSAAGRGLTSMGGAAAARIAAMSPTTGIMGMGGRGMLSGTGMLGARLTQGAGWAMRGLGGLSRLASGPLGLAVTAAMALPAIGRAAGVGTVQEGIMGSRASDVAAMSEAGLLQTEDWETGMVEDVLNKRRSGADRYVGVVGYGEDATDSVWNSIGKAYGSGSRSRYTTGRWMSDFASKDFSMRGIKGLGRDQYGSFRMAMQNIWKDKQQEIEGMTLDEFDAAVEGGDTAQNVAGVRVRRSIENFKSEMKKAGYAHLLTGDVSEQNRVAAAAMGIGSGQTAEVSQIIGRMQGRLSRFEGMSQDEMLASSSASFEGMFAQEMTNRRFQQRQTHTGGLQQMGIPFLAATAISGGGSGAAGVINAARGLLGGDSSDPYLKAVDRSMGKAAGEAGSQVIMGMGAGEMARAFRLNRGSRNMQGSRNIVKQIVERAAADGMEGAELKQLEITLSSKQGLASIDRQVAARMQRDRGKDITNYAESKQVDAQKYSQYMSTGSLREELEASGIPNAGRLAEAMDELQAFYANAGDGRKGDDYLKEEAALKSRLQGVLGSFDDSEAGEISELLGSLGSSAGSATFLEASLVAASVGKRRGMVKRASKKTGTFGGRMKRMSAFFGNTDAAKAAFGMGRDKEMNRYVRAHIKEKGSLPEMMQEKLVRQMAQGINSGDRSEDLASARRHFQNIVSMGLDADGLSDEDMKEGDFIAAATVADRVGAQKGAMSSARPGARGRGDMGEVTAVKEFTKALGEATTALKGIKSTGTNKDSSDGSD